MKKLLTSLLSLCLTSVVHATGDDLVHQSLLKNEVAWKELGTSSTDSMPLGNGDIGLNVWTEQNGDLLFYISKSDAWTEDGNLVKVGRVRVSLTPNSFQPGKPFQQILKLENGEIVVTGGPENDSSSIRIWVDANHPVVRVEAKTPQPARLKVTVEPWRTDWIKDDPKGNNTSPDFLLPASGDTVAWAHRNAGKCRAPQMQNITFGASLFGTGLAVDGERSLVSKTPQTSQNFSIHVVTATTPTLEEWSALLQKQVSATNLLDWEKSRTEHQTWWREFWHRSWIDISGDDTARKVSQGYVLQRFVTACAGRGATAIKFNGSIFTMDNPGEKMGKDKVTNQDIIRPVNADFRAWGGQYWFQNTRPMYWPRLAAGDFDLMQPLFRQYRSQLESNATQVKTFYGHDGSYFAETAPHWGGISNILPDKPGSYTFRYFTPILELSSMMLDYYAYTGDEALVRETLLPIAMSGLTFFEQHFPRDAAGKLFLDKDNSIEMYWDVQNPLPDIAGLHWVTDHLLTLPDSLLGAANREQILRLQKILPDIPVGDKDGKKVILSAVAGQELKSHNSENPELYAVYPFRFYGVGKPDLDVAMNTFNARLNKRSGCWHQDPMDAAYLGLTDEAKKGVVKCLTNSDPKLKFPAFWERGHDYMPDEDNGGNGENGLQLMLLQCEGQKMILLPAWPADWNVSFKLHAPQNTTIEGEVSGGKLVRVEVTPASRSADLVVQPPYSHP